MYQIDQKTLLDTLNYIGGSTSQIHNAMFSHQLLSKLQDLKKIEAKKKS